MSKILNIDGITLIYEKNKINKGTYCTFGITTGSFAEKTSGTAHFLEHMLFYQTKTRTKEEINNLSDTLNLNAFTGFDLMCIDFGASSRLVEKCFEVCSDMFFNNAFTDADMDRERGPIIQEIIDGFDNKNKQSRLKHIAAVFNKPQLKISSCGTVESVKQLKEKDLREFQKDNYYKENFIISVCTDVSVFYIIELVKKYILPNLKSKKDFIAKNTYNCAISNNNFVDIMKTDNNSCVVRLTINHSKNDHKTNTKLICLDDLVFSTKGKLYKVLRDEESLIYFTPLKTEYRYKDGFVSFVKLECSKENIKQVIKRTAEVFADIRDNGINADDFEKWKETVKYDFDIDREHPSHVMTEMIYSYIEQGYVQTPKQKFNAKMAISLDEINKFSANFFDLKNIQLSVSGNVESKDIPTMQEMQAMLNQTSGIKRSA